VYRIEDYHHHTDRYYSSVQLTQNWTTENVSTHFAFSLYALVPQTFWEKQVTQWLGRHLTTYDVLAENRM
jgi:hypothetical protein